MRKYTLKYLCITFLLILFASISRAQDVSFSQNYASPLYLSPSFTGLTEGSRLAINYRDQWPSIPQTYRSMSVSFDHYFADYNSGLGFLYVRDDQQKGALVNQNIGLLYAYEVYVSRNIMIRPGIQFKFNQSFIDLSKTLFERGIDENTGRPVDYTGISLADNQLNKFDAAASVMIYSNLYWAGISVDHLVKNSKSFSEILPVDGTKITLFGGYKWVYKEGRRKSPDQSVTFAFNYRQQDYFSQLDFGAYWQYNPLELGLWYRGIPTKNKEQLSNNDAIIALFGIHLGRTRVGYSYDLTLSDLAGNTGGAHEISILYTIPSSNKPRINRNAIPCSQPGYWNAGPSRSKYRGRSRRIF
ncbi:PorP/SprF family type IX secretion system membrane protein [Plebeiibacterium sediminum]|uniref:PorP/SprF family type IX secretion system membrane protein n=1 Tax=Plebeiibacterium sediminum TaxID=2992112 RepID=A0AAE3M6Z6_9BACT|nr:PorP/SprF family type IX secretion system membrane protein [Plebeiobacterium sediminum]MCW3788269.1 PorP/SprF family type IX secretion system membrane protein [Plebeiobacterium sediminum]